MAIEVDPIEFIEWKKDTRHNDDDMLHAFRALKVAEAVKFAITTEEDRQERLKKIEGIMDQWH